MPFLEANIFPVVVSYAVSGNRLSTTLNYGVVGTVPADICGLIADEVAIQVIPSWLLCVSQDVHFQDIYCYGELANSVVPIRKPFTNSVGALAFDSVPSNLMAILQLRQIEEVSRHNGRLYIAGVSEDDVADALITGAAANGHWAALITALSTQLALSGGYFADLCAVQRSAAGVPIAPVGNVIGQISLNRSLGTQRRRTTELRQIHP